MNIILCDLVWPNEIGKESEASFSSSFLITYLSFPPTCISLKSKSKILQYGSSWTIPFKIHAQFCINLIRALFATVSLINWTPAILSFVYVFNRIGWTWMSRWLTRGTLMRKSVATNIVLFKDNLNLAHVS